MQPQRTCKVGWFFSVPQHLYGPTSKFHPSTDSLSSTPSWLYDPLLTMAVISKTPGSMNATAHPKEKEGLRVLLGQDFVNISYILSFPKLDSLTWFQAYRGVLINYNCPLLKTKQLLDKKVELVFVCLLFIINPGKQLCQENKSSFSM